MQILLPMSTEPLHSEPNKAAMDNERSWSWIANVEPSFTTENQHQRWHLSFDSMSHRVGQTTMRSFLTKGCKGRFGSLLHCYSCSTSSSFPRCPSVSHLNDSARVVVLQSFQTWALPIVSDSFDAIMHHTTRLPPSNPGHETSLVYNCHLLSDVSHPLPRHASQDHKNGRGRPENLRTHGWSPSDWPGRSVSQRFHGTGPWRAHVQDFVIFCPTFLYFA